MVVIHHTNAFAEALGNVQQGIALGSDMARTLELLADARDRRALIKAEEERRAKTAPLEERLLTTQVESAERQARYEAQAMEGGADNELQRLLSGLHTEASTLASKFFGGQLPPEVRQKLAERVGMLKEIRGANPRELSIARNAFAGDIVQSLKKDIDPYLRERTKSMLGGMMDNPTFRGDEQAMSRLQGLAQTIGDPNAVWDPMQVQEALGAVRDAHARRDGLEAIRQDLLDQVQGELENTSMLRSVSPDVRRQLRMLQGAIKAGSYDDDFARADQELRKILHSASSEERGRGWGRKWSEADPESQAIVEDAVRQEAQRRYASLLRDDPDLYQQMVNQEIAAITPIYRRKFGWMDDAPDGGAGAAPSGPQAGGAGPAHSGAQAGGVPGGPGVVQTAEPKPVYVDGRTQWRVRKALEKGDPSLARQILEAKGLDPNTDINQVQFEPVTSEQMKAWDDEVQASNRAEARRQDLQSRLKSKAGSTGEVILDLPAQPQMDAGTQEQVKALRQLASLADNLSRLQQDSGERWAPGELDKTRASAREALAKLAMEYADKYGEVPPEIAALLKKTLTPKKK